MGKKKENPPESKAERQDRLKARDEKDINPPHDKHAAKDAPAAEAETVTNAKS